MEIISKARLSNVNSGSVNSLLMGEQGNISAALTAKTHISTAKGQSLDQLAQQKANSTLVEDASEQFEAASLESHDQPVLRSATPLTSKAQMLLLMGQFQAIAGSLDDAQRTNVLAIFATQAEARMQKAREFSQHLDSLHAQFSELESEFALAQGVVDAASDEVATIKRKLEAAQKALAELLETLGVTDPDDPAVADDPDVRQAKQAVADTQNALGRAQTAHHTAQTAAEQKLGAMQSSLNEINAATAEMNRQFRDVNIVGNGNQIVRNATAQSENALTKTAMMIRLIAEFIATMEKNASDKLQNDLEVNRIQTKARQAEMQRKADEYAEQVRKAEEAQKMANCIGKILGGIALALGAVTTVFGGGGLALMAIGVALLVADPIVAAITGKSLSERIMDPLMQHIISPLMNIMSDIITQIFDKTPLGLLLNAIDKATGANMMGTVHMVVTAAVTIAAIIAVALVAKTAAKFMIEKMTQAMTSAIMQSIKQAITQVINKILPQVVNNTARQGTAALNRGMQAATRQVTRVTQEINKKVDNLSDHMSKNIMKVLKTDDPAEVQRQGKVLLHHLNMINNGIHTVIPVVRGAMNVNIANIRLQAAKAIADFNMASIDVAILRDFLNKILASFENDSNASNDMKIKISDMLSRQANAASAVVRNVRA